MKVTLLLFVVLISVSCGKKNESGKPETNRWESSPYSTEQEEAFRREFVTTAQSIIRSNAEKLELLFGPHRYSLIKERMKLENVQVTEQIIMNERSEAVRSFHRYGVLYLYIGQGNMDWRRARSGNRYNYHKLILHEALELGGINDSNYRYTNRIMPKK